MCPQKWKELQVSRDCGPCSSLFVPEVNNYAAMQILPHAIPHFQNIAIGNVNTPKCFFFLIVPLKSVRGCQTLPSMSA